MKHICNRDEFLGAVIVIVAIVGLLSLPFMVSDIFNQSADQRPYKDLHAQCVEQLNKCEVL